MATKKFPVRIVDELGRIVLPKAIRDELGIEEGSPMDITVTTDGKIVLERTVIKKKPRKRVLY